MEFLTSFFFFLLSCSLICLVSDGLRQFPPIRGQLSNTLQTWPPLGYFLLSNGFGILIGSRFFNRPFYHNFSSHCGPPFVAAPDHQILTFLEFSFGLSFTKASFTLCLLAILLLRMFFFEFAIPRIFAFISTLKIVLYQALEMPVFHSLFLGRAN